MLKSLRIRQLHQSLARFKRLSDVWPAVLAYRIAQCDGFLEQLTLSDGYTMPWLSDKTAALIDTLPADADDSALIRLLAAEFEGFHCHAVAYVDQSPVCWNSLREPFAGFIGRYPEADLYIGQQTHLTGTEAADWFTAALDPQPCL